jgi:hypothetical protein
MFRTRTYSFRCSVSFLFLKENIGVNTTQMASVEELFVLEVTNRKGKRNELFSKMLCGCPKFKLMLQKGSIIFTNKT